MAWVQKFCRYLNPSLSREAFYRVAPAPRDAVALPFVDSPSPLGIAREKCGCHRCATAQALDQLRVLLLHDVDHIGTQFQISQENFLENQSKDISRGFPHISGMPSEVKDPQAIEAGKRLKRTRLALGYTSRRLLADALHTDQSNIAKWEDGVAMTPQHAIRKLHAMHGVTWDWIYGGSLRGLPYELATKLTDDN